MKECYQKIAYVGLRQEHSTEIINVPIYIKLNDVNKYGTSKEQEELIHKVTSIMLRNNEQRIAKYINDKKKGVNSNDTKQ